VQDGDSEDEGAEEPVGDVDVPDLALDDGAEEHHGVGDPDDGDQDRDRPFEFGVFLAAREAHRQRDRGAQQHRLPAPEGERGQLVGEQTNLAGALHHVVRGGEQAADAEGEDDRVGMQRAQASVAEPWDIEVERGPGQLGRDEHPCRHADHAPDHGRNGKLAHDLVVIV